MTILGKGLAIAAVREIAANGLTPAQRAAAAQELARIGDNVAAVRAELIAIKAAKNVILDPNSTAQAKQAALQTLVTALS